MATRAPTRSTEPPAGLPQAEAIEDLVRLRLTGPITACASRLWRGSRT